MARRKSSARTLKYVGRRSERGRYVRCLRRHILKGGSDNLEPGPSTGCSEEDVRAFGLFIRNHRGLISELLSKTSQYKSSAAMRREVRRFLDILRSLELYTNQNAGVAIDRGVLGSCIELFEAFVNTFELQMLNLESRCIVEIDDGGSPVDINNKAVLASSEWRRIPFVRQVTQVSVSSESNLKRLSLPGDQLSVKITESVVRGRLFQNREETEIVRHEGVIVSCNQLLDPGERLGPLIMEIRWSGPQKTVDFHSKFSEIENYLRTIIPTESPPTAAQASGTTPARTPGTPAKRASPLPTFQEPMETPKRPRPSVPPPAPAAQPPSRAPAAQPPSRAPAAQPPPQLVWEAPPPNFPAVGVLRRRADMLSEEADEPASMTSPPTAGTYAISRSAARAIAETKKLSSSAVKSAEKKPQS